MTKRIFFMLGVIVGLLFAAIAQRKLNERLRVLEAEKAEEKARFAEYERDWKEKIAAMPFAERMEWELFEASLKSHNYQPDWTEGAVEDEESH